MWSVPGSRPPWGPLSGGVAPRPGRTRGAGAPAGVRSLPGPETGRGRGLKSGRRGPGRAGGGLTDLPSRLRTSGAHAGAAPEGGGGAAPSGSPPRAGEKSRPEFKTKRRKCPSGAERRVGGAALGACALRGPAPTPQPGGGGASRLGAGRNRRAQARSARAPAGTSGERRALGAGPGTGCGQRVWVETERDVDRRSVGSGLC